MRIIILLISICLLSCNSERDKGKIENYTFEILLEDTISIEMPSTDNISFQKKAIFNDTLYALSKNKIVVIDLKNKKFIDSILVKDYFLKSKLSSIEVISRDSLFLSDSPYSFVLLNGKGQLLSKYQIGNENVPNDSQFFDILPYMITQHTHKNIYFPILSYTYFESPHSHKKTNRIAILSLKDRIAKTTIIPTAKTAYIKNGYNFPTDVIEPNLLVNNDKIIISYPYDNTVEVFDLRGKFLFNKTHESRFLNNLPKPLTSSEYNVHQKVWNKRVTMPFFDNINYHSKVGVYSRVLYHEQELKMPNGKLNNGSKRKASIILMDKEFNVVGETLFENGTLGVYKTLPLSDGVLIATNSKYWHDENELVYKYKYVIKKIKK